MLPRTGGPLKAVHKENISPDLHVGIYREDSRISDTSCGTLQFDMDNASTPVFRNRQQRLNPDCGSKLTVPLRSSSCRTEKLHLLSSLTDIRQHFPIKSASGNRTYNEDHAKLSANRLIPGAKRQGSVDSEDVTSPKQARHSSSINAADVKSVNLTMGSFVKTHPRYFRRRSGGEFLNEEPGCKLSPVCAVPMLEAFPSHLSCSDRSLLKAECRTIETQTSPLNDSKVTVSQMNRKSRSKCHRQSVGSSHVLSGLRKTFGNLKRAISAERLVQRSSQQTHAEINYPTPTINVVKTRRSLSSLQIQSVKSFGLRRASLRLSQSKQLCADNVNTHKVEANESAEVRAVDPLRPSSDTQLSCRVVERCPDGSQRVALRRSSTKQQFGFFIAKDAKGIYISRLGNVRSASKLWEVFHVGDRMLEVQGVSCSKLSVEDVRNLIRGCELAEFRIKPARASTSRNNGS